VQDGTGSYQIPDVTLAQEVQRLRTQMALTWPREAERLGAWGIAQSRALLELGSGPGCVTQELLALAPHAQITALELDPRMCAAGQVLADAPPRWHGVNASIMATGLPDASHDFALARYLFQHLSDPVGAAQEVWRVLTPGSPLVIIDIDEAWSILLDPPLVADQRQRLAAAAQQAMQGGNRYIGRRLPRILQSAGFHVSHFETVVLHNDVIGYGPFLASLTL
jgi:ubiquinone/menaquinone biosynthesis C-methylase UbiE